MRIGYNPNRNKTLEPTYFTHQVVIPVHIPNQKGYFKDSFQIFKFCLESLFKTCHERTFFSVVNNGSCKEVKDYIDKLLHENKIHEVLHTKAIGKINAILKAIVGHNIRLVTITDADVLFQNGWQKSTYDVFEAFSKAGVVSPVPVFRKQMEYTYPIHFDYLFSKKIRFKSVKNPEAMTRFALSIGWPWLDNKWKDIIMTLTDNGVTAVVGAPHFVATYKSELFNNLPLKSSNDFLGNMSEQLFLDETVLKFSAYRLSTYDNYAYHMGNVKEDWMPENLRELKKMDFEINEYLFNKLKSSGCWRFIKSILFKKIITANFIKQIYYRSKGLSKNRLNDF